MHLIQLNMPEEYAKMSTVDKKIPLKILFVDTTRAILPFKKKKCSRNLRNIRKTFPAEIKSSRRRRMSKKEKEKRKRSSEEENANVSPMRIPRKNASLFLATALILISL